MTQLFQAPNPPSGSQGESWYPVSLRSAYCATQSAWFFAICDQSSSVVTLLVDLIQEQLSLIGSDATVGFIVEHRDAAAKVVLAVGVEELGLLYRVGLVKEMVEAIELLLADRRLDKRVASRINLIDALGRLAEYEIVIDLSEVETSLIIRNVDALHRHRASPLIALNEPKQTASSSSLVHVLIELAPSSGSRSAYVPLSFARQIITTWLPYSRSPS